MPLTSELAAWRAAQRTPTFWWRDDDAVSATPELDCLIDLSTDLDIPAHLAVIPKYADASLADVCASNPLLVPMVHGWSHENHAPEGQKKAEFGHPRSALVTDAQRGLERMQDLFGNGFLPFFVPPWNRIDADLVRDLPALGYICLSTFTPRPHRLAAGDLVQINTHIDPIFWRGGGGLAEGNALITLAAKTLRDQRSGKADADEPLGILTHHLVQDDAVWDCVKTLFMVLLGGGALPINFLNLRGKFP